MSTTQRQIRRRPNPEQIRIVRSRTTQPQLVVAEAAPAAPVAEATVSSLWEKPYHELTKEELRILKQQFFRS